MAEDERRQPRPWISGLVFGEGPRWHEGALWFSDIGAGCVRRARDDGEIETIVEVPGRPSGLGWRPDGTLLVVSMHAHRLLAWNGEALAEVADLSPWCGGDANDMVVDDRGGAYVGNIGFDLEQQPIEPRPTRLVRVEPDGTPRAVADDLMAPNGMAITPEGGTLIVAESGRGRLTAFSIEPDGGLGARRVYAALPDGAAPDGLCLDAEGAVWVASPTTREFLRVREGGEVAARIGTGERPAIACMLGGADRRTLHLVTAPTMSIASSIPLAAGRIDRVRVEVPGAGRP